MAVKEVNHSLPLPYRGQVINIPSVIEAVAVRGKEFRIIDNGHRVFRDDGRCASVGIINGYGMRSRRYIREDIARVKRPEIQLIEIVSGVGGINGNDGIVAEKTGGRPGYAVECYPIDGNRDGLWQRTFPGIWSENVLRNVGGQINNRWTPRAIDPKRRCCRQYRDSRIFTKYDIRESRVYRLDDRNIHGNCGRTDPGIGCKGICLRHVVIDDRR